MTWCGDIIYSVDGYVLELHSNAGLRLRRRDTGFVCNPQSEKVIRRREFV